MLENKVHDSSQRYTVKGQEAMSKIVETEISSEYQEKDCEIPSLRDFKNLSH